MTKQPLFSLSLLIVFLFHCTTPLAQPVPAPALAPALPLAPAPAGPAVPDVIKILTKARQFTILIRLLRSTGSADQLKGQLKDTANGFTIFAPTDSAFTNLKSGTLNSLSDDKKVRLIQFHIVPTFYSLENLQTVSNPVRTQAGDSLPGDYPMNLITSGSQVNITTGLVNATLSGTIYSDKQLAIYQVDKVLLPQDLFVPKPPAPAPALVPSKPKAKTKPAESPESSSSTTSTVVASGAVSLTKHQVVLVSVAVAVVASFSL